MAIKYRLLQQTIKLGKDTGKTLQFARSLTTSKVTFARFCEEVSDGSTVDTADTMAVLMRMVKILRRHMEDGDAVEIDGLGIFSPTFGSDGVPLGEEFNARKSIRKPRVSFRAKPAFADLSGISFERITEEEAAARAAVTAKKKASAKPKTETPTTPPASGGGASGGTEEDGF